ncbi:hypothetical protein JCM11641_008426 [Rhodosporidiobolus odoratus]
MSVAVYPVTPSSVLRQHLQQLQQLVQAGTLTNEAALATYLLDHGPLIVWNNSLAGVGLHQIAFPRRVDEIFWETGRVAIRSKNGHRWVKDFAQIAAIDQAEYARLEAGEQLWWDAFNAAPGNKDDKVRAAMENRVQTGLAAGLPSYGLVSSH